LYKHDLYKPDFYKLNVYKMNVLFTILISNIKVVVLGSNSRDASSEPHTGLTFRPWKVRRSL